jgi:hypothetical protein
MRRTILTAVAVLVAIAAALTGVAVAGVGGSTVTRARLERSLPVVFSHMYVDQARLLGHPGVSYGSLHAKAMCDKHGPDVADIGPGGDWVCLMSWTDPNVPMPSEGYGKFELNVHSNDCYTAGGPSKLTGFLTLTDTHGREVTNPAFEFDGCFDPHATNTATGTFYPSVLGVISPSVAPDPQGRVAPQLSCGTGSKGCAGTVSATAGTTSLGTVAFRMKEESTTKLAFPTPVPAGTKEVTFQVKVTDGSTSSSPVTLPVQAH